MGSLLLDRAPIIKAGLSPTLSDYTDPLPQALVLTAIVIGFATTALFLVVLLALRGLSGTDHVDGEEREA
jgi:multicomponent K+:H+ antiporter subunit C